VRGFPGDRGAGDRTSRGGRSLPRAGAREPSLPRAVRGSGGRYAPVAAM